MVQTCQTCRYWSDQQARVHDHHGLQAVCLSRGIWAGLWTRPNSTCEDWASGHLGAVDEPDQPADRYERDQVA